MHWLDRIHELDPVADHQEIYRISVGHEFPWDYQRALLCGCYPAPLRPAVRQAVLALLDPPMLAAFGFRPAPRWLFRPTSTPGGWPAETGRGIPAAARSSNSLIRH